MMLHGQSHDMSCDSLAEIGSCAGGGKTATAVLMGYGCHGNCRYSGCGQRWRVACCGGRSGRHYCLPIGRFKRESQCQHDHLVSDI